MCLTFYQNILNLEGEPPFLLFEVLRPKSDHPRIAYDLTSLMQTVMEKIVLLS